MNYSTIILIILWIAVVLKYRPHRSSLPLSYRIQLLILSLYFTWMGDFGLRLFVWCLIHPSGFVQYFYIPTGIFPNWATAIITILESASGLVMLSIGFQLAQQKAIVMKAGRTFAPWLWIIVCLALALALEKHHDGDGIRYASHVIAVCFFTGIYLWLYRFCSSTANVELMKPETPENAPAQPG
jgi:hypothetical protein